MRGLTEVMALAMACLTVSMGWSQTPCDNGSAGIYPCQNMDLYAYMATDEVGGGEMNDVWGWVDPTDGTEYVLLGRTTGTAFIDISDPVNPVLVANLSTQTTSSTWRDIKVYNNHAFVVSEAGGHGMQVVDLTQLGQITNPPVQLQADAWYDGFGNAHNIVINEGSGRAYGVGTNTASGGLHIVDLQDPMNPSILGTFDGDGYTHDAQVVNYAGPDLNYQGKEVAFCCNENTVTIVDVTDATDATLISSTGYAGANYTHQGWLTEDHQFFLSNDELDEMNLGVNTTTFIWDVSDLSAPVLAGTYVHPTAAIDHNMYTKDSLVYQSNYRAGLRVLNASNIAQGQLEEMAYFDVFPSGDEAQFNGTWSNYPYFPSGVIAVSHIEEGLFLVKLSDNIEAYGCMDETACNFDPEATVDDGSCLEFNVCGGCEGEELICVGCMDEASCNYSELATIDDGSCFQVEALVPQAVVQDAGPVTFLASLGAYWFETDTSSEALAFGPTFTMPLVESDTSIWVANSNAEMNVSGGKVAPDFGNGQYHPNNNRWLRFDVHQDAVLHSVEVHSQNGGNATVEVLDNSGAMVASVSQPLSSGLNVLNLEIEIPAGEGYQIRAGENFPLLWRDDNQADVNFPYDIGGLASITGTTIQGENEFEYYYFYYNWTMSSLDPCLSERVEFQVIVDETMGCMDEAACNYSPEAEEDNGTCEFPGDSCDDENEATVEDTINDDCVCEGIIPVPGCINPFACNYNDEAHVSDGSCVFPGDPCDDGDVLTTNDMYTDSCTCEGALTTGIPGLERNLALYPNPAHGHVNLEIGGHKMASVSLLDESGRTLQTWNVQGSTRLDVSAWSEGTYVLIVNMGEGEPLRRRLVLLRN